MGIPDIQFGLVPGTPVNFIPGKTPWETRWRCMSLNGHATGTDWFEVPKAYVREYPHNIWPYMVQYLHFRILEFPLVSPSNPLKLWFSLVVIHGYHLIFSTKVNINNNELMDRSFRENRNRSPCSLSSSFRGVLDYFNHPILGMKQLRSWIPTITKKILH